MEWKIEERINFFFRRVIDKVGTYLAKIGISPNVLTICGVFFSFIAALVIAKCSLLIGAFVVLFASSFDLLDGPVARATKKASKFGAVFDDVCDRFGEMFCFSGILWLQTTHVGFLTVFLAGMSSVLVSYSKASANANGFNISAGIFGRPARILLLVLLMLLNPWLAISSSLWLLAGLNGFTIIKRIVKVQKQSA